VRRRPPACHLGDRTLDLGGGDNWRLPVLNHRARGLPMKYTKPSASVRNEITGVETSRRASRHSSRLRL